MTPISRIYDDGAQARAVVSELKAQGVPDSDISLVTRSNDETVDAESSGLANGATIGTIAGGGAGLLAGLGMLAIPGVGPVVAAGWLLATLTGAGVGAASGGIIGALTDAGTDPDDAHVYAESLRRGGSLVTVRTNDLRDADIKAIMDEASPVDIAKRRGEYRSDGWDTFDPKAPAYRPDGDRR